MSIKSLHTLLLLLVTIPFAQSCSRSCPPDQLRKVLVRVSSEEGKKNALSCSVANGVTGGPAVIPLGEGFIVGMTMCSADEFDVMTMAGIVQIENDEEMHVLNGGE